jgi:hypothetical protein
MTTATQSVGLRRTRLLAWLHDPRSEKLPDIAKHGFDYKGSMWTAGQIVELTDIYDGEANPRARCLDDLNALMRSGEVMRWGNRDGGTDRKWSAWGNL